MTDYILHLKDIPVEAYAKVASSNGTDDTLEFRYDKEKRKWPEDKVFSVLDTGSKGVGWAKYIGGETFVGTVTNVVFLRDFQSVKPTNCANWFRGQSSNSRIKTFTNMQYLDTSAVTKMDYMFAGCCSLEEPPDLTSMDTSRVTGMSYMFYACINMKKAPDLSKFSMTSIVNLNSMFRDCSSMQDAPDTFNWNNASNLEDISAMFYGCSNMQNAPQMTFCNTPSLNNIRELFRDCKSLNKDSNLIGKSWNVQNVSSFYAIFMNCSSMVVPPDVSGWTTTSCASYSDMFYGCSSLQTAPNMSSWNSSNVTDMSGMFFGCSSLSEIDISSFTFTSETKTGLTHTESAPYGGMFMNCEKLEHVLCNTDWSKTISSEKSYYMFTGCSLLPHFQATIDDQYRNNKYAYPDNGQAGYFTSKNPVIKLQFAPGCNGEFRDKDGNVITSYEGTFGDHSVFVRPVALNSWEKVKRVVDNADTQYPIVEGWINLDFSAEYTLTAITGPAQEVYAAVESSANGNNDLLTFYCDGERETHGNFTWLCESTGDEAPPWAGFVGSQSFEPSVTTVIFTDEFVSNEKVTSCYQWFYSPSPSIYQSKITEFRNIENCKFANANNYGSMFENCKSISNIDISSLSFSSSSNTRNMFAGCSNLTNIYYDRDLRDVLSPEQSADMFLNSSHLPHFSDSGSFDKTFAYPDDGLHGFFTAKNPTIKLTSFSEGHYSLTRGGEAIPGEITRSAGEDVTIYVVVDDPELELKKVTDNTTFSYPIGQGGDNFVLHFDANYTISVLVKVKTEPYAALASSANGNVNDQLILAYDNKRYTFETTFDIPTSGTPAWSPYLDGSGASVSKVVIDQTFQNATPKSLYSWFKQSTSNPTLTSITGLNYINTSEVTIMSCLFYGAKNVQDFSGINGWNVKKVTKFIEMFTSCDLRNSGIDFSNWQTESLENTARMFYQANITSASESIKGIGTWQTPNLKYCDYMFYGCGTMTYGPDLSGWTLSNCELLTSMFEGCTSLQSINISGLKCADNCNFAGMFSGCISLHEIYINNINFTNFSKVSDSAKVTGMFHNCSNLVRIYCDSDLSSIFTDLNSIYMFDGCTSLPHYDTTSPVIDRTYAYPDNGLSGYFTSLNPTIQLTGLGVDGHFEYGGQTVDHVTGAFGSTAQVKAVVTNTEKKLAFVKDNAGTHEYFPNDDGEFTVYFDACFTITAKASIEEAYAYITSSANGVNDSLIFNYDAKKSTHGDLVWNCENTEGSPPWADYVGSDISSVTSVTFSDDFNKCGKVTSCAKWFYGGMRYQSKISSFNNIQDFDARNVTSMQSMFSNCTKIFTAPDLSNWKTSTLLTKVDSMFYNCSNIKSPPDVSKINMTNVDTIASMFSLCRSLENVPDMSNWTFTRLDNCGSLFAEDNKLQGTVDISGWNTLKVSSTSFMFSNCSLLQNIKLGGIDSFPLLNYTKSMFSGCNGLEYIFWDKDLSSLTPSSSSAGMFTSCYKLKAWLKDKDHVDCTYAFPYNGVDGFFTSNMPTIQLTGLGNDGHFEYGGQTVESVTGEPRTTAQVKVVITNSKKTLDTITDNASAYEYTPDTDGFFTVHFDACYTITATTKDSAKPYALLTSSSNGTDDLLKFVVDGNRGSWPADHTFDVESVATYPGWYEAIAGSAPTITSVVIEESFKQARPKCLDYWFAQNIDIALSKLTSISGLQYIDTSEVTTFSHTFYKCSALSSLEDISCWKINENPSGTMLSGMFSGCTNIQTFTGFNPESNVKVSSASDMFSCCSNLKSVDISKLTFNSSSYLSWMFDRCGNLDTIYYDVDLRSTISQSSSIQMFNECNKLPNFSSGVIDSRAAYPNDGVGGYFTTKTPTIQLTGLGSDGHFEYGGQTVTSVSGNLGTTAQVKVVVTNPDKTLGSIIDNASAYEYTPDAEGFITVHFDACYTIIASFNLLAKAVHTTDDSGGTLTFYYDDQIHTGDSIIDVPTSPPKTSSPFLEVAATTNKVVFTEGFYAFDKITSLNSWFKQFSYLTEVEGINYLNTGAVTTMLEAFAYSGIVSMDFSGNNLNNLSSTTGLTRIFCNCKSLKSFKFPSSGINASASTSGLAYGCSKLEEVDAGSLKFSYGDRDGGCFSGCILLKKVVTNNTWSSRFKTLLGETEGSYSTWHVQSSGQDVLSYDIMGRSGGDTYTRVEDKKLSDYTIDELSAISNDIAINGESSQYWTDFNGYLTNAFNINTSTGKPYDNGNTSGTLEDPLNHIMINGVPCRIIGLNHDPANGESGITMMATAPVTTSIWGSFTAGTEYDYGASSLSDAANNWTNSISAYCKTITKKYTKVSGSLYPGFTTSQGSINTKGFVLSFMELTGTGPGSEDPAIEYLEEGSKYADSYKLFAGITTSIIWTRTLDDCTPNNQAVTIDHSGWLALPTRTFAVSCDVVPAFCLGTSSFNGILDIANLTSVFDELLNLFAVMLHID